MIGAMRRERKKILAGIAPLANLGVKPAPMNSPDHDCSTHAMLTLPTAESAEHFAAIFPSVIAGKTGRHNYTEWDQVLMGFGAAHPEMNPFEFPANKECRKTYSKTCARARSTSSTERSWRRCTLSTPTQEIEDAIHNIGVAARVVFGGLRREEADLRNVKPVDAQKFDMKVTGSAEVRDFAGKREEHMSDRTMPALASRAAAMASARRSSSAWPARRMPRTSRCRSISWVARRRPASTAISPAAPRRPARTSASR